MRVMIILRGSEDIESGTMPTEEMLNDMNRFNEELVNAGVMVGGEGCIQRQRAFALHSRTARQQ